jgi:hypothetical protein
LALACGEEPLAEGEVYLVEHKGFDPGAAWTWHDDAARIGVPVDEQPELDEEALLHGQVASEGQIELRRGARFADGAEAGHLTFQAESPDLVLTSWSLGEAEGSGQLKLGDAIVGEGDRHASGDFVCTSSTTSDQDTFYALFEDVLIFDCTGPGPAARWAFAREIGLVSVSGEGILLDLVAPF